MIKNDFENNSKNLNNYVYSIASLFYALEYNKVTKEAQAQSARILQNVIKEDRYFYKQFNRSKYFSYVFVLFQTEKLYNPKYFKENLDKYEVYLRYHPIDVKISETQKNFYNDLIEYLKESTNK